jgi:hypothetical protein
MVFISILTLIVAKALPLLNKQISSIHFTRIASIIFIYTGAITLNCLYIQSIGSGIGIYSGLFHITQISQLIEIFLFIIGGLILIGWPQVLPPLPRQGVVRNPINKSLIDLTSARNMAAFAPLATTTASALARVAVVAKAKVDVGQWEARDEVTIKNNVRYQSNVLISPPLSNFIINYKGKAGEQNSLESYRLVSSIESYSTDYSIIVLFSILGSSLLISSFDLISLYLSIELQSFGLYVLSTLYRDSESSTSAGLKYFLLGGLSSCLILLGSGLIYSYTGVTNFESLYLLNSISDIDQQYVIQGLSLGLIIIFVGFLFKIAAAPLHNWSPERGLGKSSLVGIKLSNSGNTLELTIPKHNRKVGGG